MIRNSAKRRGKNYRQQNPFIAATRANEGVWATTIEPQDFAAAADVLEVDGRQMPFGLLVLFASGSLNGGSLTGEMQQSAVVGGPYSAIPGVPLLVLDADNTVLSVLFVRTEPFLRLNATSTGLGPLFCSAVIGFGNTLTGSP